MTNEVLQKTASDEQNVSSSNGLEPFPKLRFLEFKNTYKKIKLNKAVERIQRKDPTSEAPVMMLSAASGFIMQSEKYSRENAGQSLKKYILLKKGELAYNHGASKYKPFGCCFELKEEEARIPYVYHCFAVKENNDKSYIARLLNNQKIDQQLKRLISSSVRMDGLLNISYEEYTGIDLYLPSLPEQQKIAAFLSLVDVRIEKQRKLVENLKKYKRGLLSCIFDNKLIGENWKKYKLSSILKERSTYSEKDGSYEHVTLSRDGIIPKTERYNRDFLVSSENKKYKITKMGDICYNPANMKFGVICLNTYGNAIFSPIYITFEIKSDFDKPFVGLYMTRNDFINRSLKFQQGTVYERMAVSPEDLLSMDIELPNLEVQKRISNIFTILDKKIVRENNIFNELQKMKRALLQQMFI